MHLGFVGGGGGFRPARADIGDIQGLGEIAPIIAAIVLHQIHFAKAGALVVPFGKGANRNLMFQ